MGTEFRFAVNVLPKAGILDPQGRAVEGSLDHLGIAGVSAVRVGRRVELTVAAPDETAAREVVDRLAGELLSNPLIEAFAVERLQTTSSTTSTASTPSASSAAPTAPATAGTSESGAR
ncbi:MAG TPA: phosphoribosylformylglycinamidine synthase subunit PurS [Candidatus Limnocylindrales bacterium]|nr:phosphoribosylformylglycinamidine synthase subunit PurS [Candidatus Limnocylindrales bacterium]